MDKRRTSGTLAAVFAAFLAILTPLPALAAPWLVISDIHYNPSDASPTMPHIGQDANDALVTSTLAEAVSVDRDAPVVVITGDLLAHHFPAGPLAAQTAADLARRFDAAFPHAQFILALGNNDSACGDYETTPGDAFLQSVATAWEPLVNRGGNAPDFLASFPKYAGYTTQLPFGRAVIADDTFWSTKYKDACDPQNATSDASIAAFSSAVAAPSKGATWIVLHIPPGVDGFPALGGQPAVPFLRPAAEAAFESAAALPAANVTLVVAAHIHRFSYRFSSETPQAARPVLVAPAVSPIYGNNPSFLTLDVGSDGIVTNATEYALHGLAWQREGSLADLGIANVTDDTLHALSTRLSGSAQLRATFLDLYAGGGLSGIDDAHYPIVGCAATALTPASFAACLAAP